MAASTKFKMKLAIETSASRGDFLFERSRKGFNTVNDMSERAIKYEGYLENGRIKSRSGALSFRRRQEDVTC